MDRSKIEQHFREILKEIGEDPDREGIQATPKRVARMYHDSFYGYKKKLVIMNEVERNDCNYKEDIIPITTFKNESEGMLIRSVSGISFCEHHTAPFSYKVHVGILPRDKILGMSKIDIIVKYFGARLQIQERMTKQIADWIMKNLDAKGVIVQMVGIHMCAEIQGHSGDFTTTEVRGYFLENNDNCKEEFLQTIARKEK
jgi:GTP cyclohydrolase I